jgi:transcriptional regulator with XRE-family HTH domain
MRISVGAAALRRRLAPAPNTLTQAQIAERLGVSQAAVSAWVRGVSKPEGETRRAALELMCGVPASSWDDDDGIVESVDADDSAAPPRSATG